MPETMIAALAGGTLSSLKRLEEGAIEVVRSLCAGFCVAYFTAPSAAASLSKAFDIAVSNGAAAIVIAYWGPWAVDEVIYKFRAMKAFNKWK